MKCRLILVSAGLLISALPRGNGAAVEKPAIRILVTPPWDPGGPDRMALISGKVTGDCKRCKVVLYSHGDVWYVQPYEKQSETAIQPDGTWSNRIHLGTEYAALLTTSDYVPPVQTGVLPSGGAVLASTIEAGKKQ